LALAELQDVRPRLLKSVQELKPNLDPNAASGMDAITERAVSSL